MNYFFVLIVSVISINIGTAQTVFSSSNFLKTAESETALSHHQQKVDFLNNNEYEVPVIDKLEFRTQTDEFDFKQQEYRVRMSPTGLKERQEYRKFHQSTIQFEATEKQGILQDALINRYNLLVDWKNLTQQLALFRQQELVVQDRMMVLKRQALTENFTITSLIDAENTLHDIQQDILEKELQQQRLENFVKISLNSPKKIQLDTSNWLKLSTLKNAISDLKIVTSTHPNLIQRQAKIEQITAEEKLEIARNQQWLDFVETRYQNDNKNPLGEEFSIGVGIRIPFKSQVQLDVNELSLDRLETQNALDLKTTELTTEITEIQEKLDLLFQQHDLITTQMEESQAQFSLDQFKKMTNANPLALLKIQENLLKREVSLQKIEARAFEYYVDLLDLTGRVVEVPLRNYLTNDFEVF